MRAQDLSQLTEDDPMAVALKHAHDASKVDPPTRARPAAEQTRADCAQLTGNEGDEWRPCNVFVGKPLNVNGWCSVWVPKG